MTYEQFCSTPRHEETDCGRNCYGGWNVGMIQVAASNAADAERQAKLKDAEGKRTELWHGAADSREQAVALCEADALRDLYSRETWEAFYGDEDAA